MISIKKIEHELPCSLRSLPYSRYSNSRKALVSIMGLRKLKLLNQFICLVAMSTALQGAYALERVDNFMLLDHMGDAHELYYHRNASAIVMMVQGNGCPIVRNAIGEFKELREK